MKQYVCSESVFHILVYTCTLRAITKAGVEMGTILVILFYTKSVQYKTGRLGTGIPKNQTRFKNGQSRFLTVLVYS